METIQNHTFMVRRLFSCVPALVMVALLLPGICLAESIAVAIMKAGGDPDPDAAAGR